MSFRNRLTLFFVAIVIVPMISLAVVLFRLISDNESSKADAQVAARQESARNLYDEDVERAGRLAAVIGADQRFARALRQGDRAGLRARSNALLRDVGVVRMRVASGGTELIDTGRPDAVAVAERELVDDDASRRYELELSARTATALARRIKRVTSLETVLQVDGRVLATTLHGAPANVPADGGEIEVGGKDYRAASFEAPHFDGQRLRVSILASRAQLESDTGRARLLAAGLLAGFFALAFLFAVLISRSLQGQIATLLEAARRLGRGEFSAQVPTQGRDEFAALGDEFNRMAGQLEGRLQELHRERSRLETTMRRIGEAFASNLDREALLEIALRTAVDGVGADGGRVREIDGGAEPETRAVTGDISGMEDVVARVEREVLESGQPRELATDAGSALAHPLRSAQAPTARGVVSVWRERRAFAPSERELFHYLAGQLAVSLENVSLHETVQRQAVIDELTGLFNHRRFQESLAAELERARRFEQDLALVMLDVDNFKSVNDTYGHQVGDEVLRQVSRVLREESREVDAPARYGGEELAVILPGTDLEGAYNLAERVRRRIAGMDIPARDGATLRVTASFGAAAVSESASDQKSLIAAADAALYAAKGAGKNRTVRAG